MLRPIVALGERVAEQVAGDIDPAARVGVLQPRAADLGVLLVDDGVDAGLSQPVRRQQARHAGTDHRDAKRSIRGDARWRSTTAREGLLRTHRAPRAATPGSRRPAPRDIIQAMIGRTVSAVGCGAVGQPASRSSIERPQGDGCGRCAC